MPGRKKSPNHGMLKGIRPPKAAPCFKAGEQRTRDAAKKGGQAYRAKVERFKTLREAAEALRDLPSEKDAKLSNGVAAVLGVFRSAADGDSRALKVMAELLGEMKQKIELSEMPTLIDDVPRAPDPDGDD